jgi:hypothetical protein
MNDIQDTVGREARWSAERNAGPEAVSVLVDLTPVAAGANETVARMVAPMVAKRHYPDGSFGEVLHVEQVGPLQYEVAVERTHPLSAVVFGRMPEATR